MTPEIITAFATGIATFIAAISALIVAIRTKCIVEKDVSSKDVKLQEIHLLVNSKFDKAIQTIADLQSKIAELTNLPIDIEKAQIAKEQAAKP